MKTTHHFFDSTEIVTAQEAEARWTSAAKERDEMETYEDGTVVQIGSRRFALQAWDEEDQKCEGEVVYTGYTRADWDSETDGTAIVVQTADGALVWTEADYNPQFHDAGGLRVSGRWHDGKVKDLGRIWPCA